MRDFKAYLRAPPTPVLKFEILEKRSYPTFFFPKSIQYKYNVHYIHIVDDEEEKKKNNS